MSVVVVQTVENAKETKAVFGKIVPRQKVQLSFQHGGKVASIEKSAGDRVETGEVIASLEQAEAISRQQQFLSALKRAEESLATATAETAPEIQQRITQIKAQLQGIEAAIKQGQIVAPFAGVISTVDISVNQNVPPSMTAVTLIADAPPLVEVRVAASISALIQEEQDVWAAIEDRSNLVRILSRKPIRGPVESELITFQFDGELREGSWSYDDVIELRFFQETTQPGYWLPMSVLQQSSDDRWAVYVATPVNEEQTSFKVDRRMVNVLLVQNGEVLVDDSVNAGELVIRDGTHRVVVGQQVKPHVFQGVGQ